MYMAVYVYNYFVHEVSMVIHLAMYYMFYNRFIYIYLFVVIYVCISERVYISKR